MVTDLMAEVLYFEYLKFSFVIPPDKHGQVSAYPICHSEATVRGCSSKYLFSKNLQYSQGNIWITHRPSGLHLY